MKPMTPPNRLHARFLPALALLLAVLVLAPPAHAQIFDKIKDKVKDEAEERIDKNIDQGVEKGADAIEGGIKNAVKCAVGDDACIDEAQKDGKTVVLTDEDGTVKRDENGNPVTASGSEGVGEANANYDFKPGERTIFAEDFSSDNVGDFPRSMEFKGGSMEVVEWKGGRALRAKAPSKFDIALPEALPEQFTLEFEFYTPDFVNSIIVYSVDGEGEATGKQYLQVDPYGNGIGIKARERDGVSSMGSARDQLTSQLTPIRLMADGAYVKVFAGTERVANIPNAELGRTRTLRFDFNDVRDEPAYVANIRVAAGGKDLYSALESEGRVAVQDILFDTGKATIKPESAEAMKKIATLLTEHPDLRLLVQGHTDNQGGFDTNMTLSKERAAAVKDALVSRHGIAASRLRAMGLGQTQPAASNDTEAGRAENRRVELVKM